MCVCDVLITDPLVFSIVKLLLRLQEIIMCLRDREVGLDCTEFSGGVWSGATIIILVVACQHKLMLYCSCCSECS